MIPQWSRLLQMMVVALFAPMLMMSARADATSCGLAAGLQPLTVHSGGQARVVSIYVPRKRAAADLLPLVLDLHGSGSNGEQHAQNSGFRRLAERRGFIVASPDGAVVLDATARTHAWNIPGVPLITGKLPPADTPDDVQFIDDLIQTLTAAHCADPRRVYATGMSGGARMASVLGCRLSQHIAAIAPVAGLRAGLPSQDPSKPEPASCAPERAMPVLSFHGTGDPTNPYAGGGAAYWGYSVETALARWAQLDGCRPELRRKKISAFVSLLHYEGCRDGAVVALYVTDRTEAQGGGHVWPGASIPDEARKREFSGAPNPYLNASERALDFFLKHPLNRR